MTGGSSGQRSGLHFGTSDATESAEFTTLRNRLQEIEQILERCDELINRASASVRQLTKELTDAKAKRQETQLRLEQLHKEIKNLTAQQQQVRSLLSKNTQELTPTSDRLDTLTCSRSPAFWTTATASRTRAVSNP
jgi:chromosome segregation protein